MVFKRTRGRRFPARVVYRPTSATRKTSSIMRYKLENTVYNAVQNRNHASAVRYSAVKRGYLWFHCFLADRASRRENCSIVYTRNIYITLLQLRQLLVHSTGRVL